MNTKNSKSKRAAATGVFAAIAASSCCIPPLVAALAGVGGVAGSLSWMEPLRPYLIGLAVLAIGYAWYNHLKAKSVDDCDCEVDGKPKWYQTKWFLIGITLFAIISISFPYYSGAFYPDNNAEVVISDNSALRRINIKIDGMTCDACQNHVNHAVNQLAGIVNVNTSYADGNAVVEFDNSLTNISEIENAVNSTGYTAVEVENITIPHGQEGHECSPNGCGEKTGTGE